MISQYCETAMICLLIVFDVAISLIIFPLYMCHILFLFISFRKKWELITLLST